MTGGDRTCLEACLGERLGTTARVRSATWVAGGMSRETWFLDVDLDADTGHPRPTRLVLRRDTSVGGATLTPLRFEYDVYAALGATAVPHARTLWYEDDPRWRLDDRDFYVREFAAGSTNLPEIHQDGATGDRARRAWAREHTRALATVHQLDPDAIGLGGRLPPASVPGVALGKLHRLREQMAEVTDEPPAVFRYALRWLADRLPPDPDRVVLLKGSNGEGQEVFRDGRIVAMSDWELASLGDPASDFARCVNLVPSSGPYQLAEVLEHYAELTGLRVPAESVEWYRTSYRAEMLVVSCAAARRPPDGRPLPVNHALLASAALCIGQRALAERLGLSA